MSGPRVWVDESDLRAVLAMTELCDVDVTDEMHEAVERLYDRLDPPPSPPLRPWRANMQGHGA